MERIGIVIALKRESKGLLELLTHNQILERPYPVYQSNLNNINIFIAISGLGKSYASACTQFLIDKYNVNLIVNTGSCGGVCPKIKIGEIVCPHSVIEYDFKSIKLGTPIYTLNKDLLDIATKLGLKTVLLGSADSNADTEEKKEYLHKIGIEVADWESAGILKTSIKNNIPALILKTVTDTSSTNFVEEFLQNVKKLNKVLAEKTLEIISAL